MDASGRHAGELVTVYSAPEVAELLMSTGPVQQTSASVGEDVAAVGHVLTGG